jgi:peptidoglycan hydrolase-like protein with peptidoglycan-binding domain
MPSTADITWFKGAFKTELSLATYGTPFSEDALVALACQETGYIWSELLRQGYSAKSILKLCVGDTIDGTKGRSAFPISRSQLSSVPNGANMYEIARDCLEDIAKIGFGYKQVALNSDKFCHGFGIFQYDLQFFKEDPEWFLKREWETFGGCLKKAILELKSAATKIKAQTPTNSDKYDNDTLYKIAIVYNCGHYNPSSGLKQGFFSDGHYYGELYHDFLNLSQGVKIQMPNVSTISYYPHWVKESGDISAMESLPAGTIIGCHHRWSRETMKEVLDFKQGFLISWYCETNMNEENDDVRPTNTPVKVRIAEAKKMQDLLIAEGYSSKRFTNMFELDAARDKCEGNLEGPGNAREDALKDANLVKEAGFTYLAKSPNASFVATLVSKFGKSFVPRVVFEDCANNADYRDDAVILAKNGYVVTLVIHENIAGQESKTTLLKARNTVEAYFCESGMTVEAYHGKTANSTVGYVKIKDFNMSGIYKDAPVNSIIKPALPTSALPAFRLGLKDESVKRWQYFLIGQKLLPEGVADGYFGPQSKAATAKLQEKLNLPADGIAGQTTQVAAISLGWSLVEDPKGATDKTRLNTFEKQTGTDYPLAPTKLTHYATTAEKQAAFGVFTYKPAPTSDNPENIKITNDWEERNIIRVPVPQIKAVLGKDAPMGIYFHRRGADQLQKLWSDWEKAGLLNRVLSYDGSFVARFIRGSRTELSNHAFGTAFDINANTNGLGVTPPLLNQKGCVRELVTIANQNGFFWGGHFKGRPDGMHFELGKKL